MKHYLIKLPLILLLICGVSIVEGKRKKATLTERINSASKIYFVPLIVKPYSMSLQVEEPKEPANPE